ncbi:hypothetical protein CIB84_006331 [Bambusicola thoracicus]|uniref:Uncharacterized protein n=1 Tax=Bambusicola thoracicus TaxID=9083 RepID=A0A2P4T0P7_BAMTH|nr:hypothetical protein CIB84_006331 [Bambusicola thoracicus]
MSFSARELNTHCWAFLSQRKDGRDQPSSLCQLYH